MWRFRFVVLVVLGICCCPGTRGGTIITYREKSIANTAVTHTNFQRRQCECVHEYMMNDSCKAVSTEQVNEERAVCSYSDVKPQEADIIEANGGSLHVKRSCPEPFTLVDEVGCIWFSNKPKSFEDAKTACPEGTRLYSPSTLGMFEKFRKTLVKMKAEDDLMEIEFIIGFGRNSTSNTWQFDLGGNIGEKAVGEYPFFGNDPVENVDCARLFYKGPYSYEYHFADTDCINSKNYICQMP